MDGATKNYTCRQVCTKIIENLRKFTLFLILAVAVSCKKDDAINTRVLAVGTKCGIVSGVFNLGDVQPAVPVTIVSISRPATSGLILYNVSDANGVIWEIPDNDLQVMKQ